MAYKRKTLRRMPEHTRKLARLINELLSVATRLKNELAYIDDLERLYRAELKRQAFYKAKVESDTDPDPLANL